MEALIYIAGSVAFVLTCVVAYRRLRAHRRADIAALAWADGACMQREPYTSGPPRPVPPEAET